MKNPYINKIHLEPPKGLLNDPNGLSYFKGKYHVFHQWNRFGCNHSYKEWGLFTSTDLLQWTHEGSAILPDSLEDQHGAYSGSALVIEDELRIFYTGNAKPSGQRKSYQKMTVSQDGRSFLKKASLETPADLTEHHRDPKVFYHKNQWQMIVGGQTREGNGAISLFTSEDLENWQYQGLFFTDEALDQMCECPDLLDFDDQQLLLICPQKRDLVSDKDISSYSGYYLGQIEHHKFKPSTDLQTLDKGFDFYAPQTFRDPKGRYLMWAWMSRMTEEEELACPTKDYGYLHCLTMPREISLENGKLYQRPIEEIMKATREIWIDDSEQKDFLQEEDTYLLEIDFKEKPNQFYLHLADSEVVLSFQDKKLNLKRRSWVDGSYQEKIEFVDKLENLQVFLDQSALEIFVNHGESVMSLRYFPKDKTKKHLITCDTGHTATLSKIIIGENHG